MDSQLKYRVIAVVLEHFCSEQTSKHIHIVKKQGSSQTNRRCTRIFTCIGRAHGGGARRDRTDDLLLAKQALSQLSYGPAVALRAPDDVGGSG